MDKNTLKPQTFLALKKAVFYNSLPVSHDSLAISSKILFLGVSKSNRGFLPEIKKEFPNFTLFKLYFQALLAGKVLKNSLMGV